MPGICLGLPSWLGGKTLVFQIRDLRASLPESWFGDDGHARTVVTSPSEEREAPRQSAARGTGGNALLR